MANTTFNGPVRSENGFKSIIKNATTGALTNEMVLSTYNATIDIAASGTDPVNFLDRSVPNLRERRGGPSGGAYYQLPSKSGLVQSMADEANCCRTWQWISD